MNRYFECANKNIFIIIDHGRYKEAYNKFR